MRFLRDRKISSRFGGVQPNKRLKLAAVTSREELRCLAG